MNRFIVVTCLALAACVSAAPPEAKSVDANGEVTLRPGDQFFLEEDMPLQLVNVAEDSRCPTDTTCIWAGEIKILLDGVKGFMRPAYLRQGDSTTIDKYQVTLVRVEPQPVSTAKIAREDYRVTLRVAH